MKNLKALALTALTALTLTAPVQARPTVTAPTVNCEFNGVREFCKVVEDTEGYEVTWVADGTITYYTKGDNNGKAQVVTNNGNVPATRMRENVWQTANGTTVLDIYAQPIVTPAAPAAPATTGFMDTVMGGLNEITGAGLGLDFNTLANTNTTVEGPCATGTDRFGNTVCTGNNGVVQHEIRRDGRGNQEYRF